MVDVIVARRDWQLDVLSDCYHFLLAFLDLVFVLGLGHGEGLCVNHAILLAGHHGLLLNLAHGRLGVFMLLLHHFLKDLLVSNRSQ